MSVVKFSDAITRPPVNSPANRVRVLVLSALAVVLSLVAGYGVSIGNKRFAVLSLAVFVGLALVTLACTRFLWFVLALLAIRSSIDVLQVSSSGAGTTAGNTVGNLGANASSLLGVLFLLASFLWMAGRAHAGGLRPMSALTKWLLAFYLAGALSIVTSQHIQASALQSLRIMTGIVMFVVLEQLIVDRRTMRLVLWACFVSLVIPLVYTAYGLATGHAGSQVKSGFTRIVGTFSETNDYGRFLGFMIVVGVALLPFLSRRRRLLFSCVLVVAAAFLVLTLTLGAMIGTIIGVVLVGVLQRRKRLLVSLVVAGIIALAAAPGLSGRLHDTGSANQIGGAPTGNSLAWRLNYWEEILPLANSNPITGIGLNSTQYETSTAKQPHNDYLRAYVETGLLGFFTYVGAVISLLTVTWRAVRRPLRGTRDHAVGAGAWACMVAFAIESLADNVITNVVNLWYVLAFAAVAAFIARTHLGRKDAPYEAPQLRRIDVPLDGSA